MTMKTKMSKSESLRSVIQCAPLLQKQLNLPSHRNKRNRKRSNPLHNIPDQNTEASTYLPQRVGAGPTNKKVRGKIMDSNLNGIRSADTREKSALHAKR